MRQRPALDLDELTFVPEAGDSWERCRGRSGAPSSGWMSSFQQTALVLVAVGIELRRPQEG